MHMLQKWVKGAAWKPLYPSISCRNTSGHSVWESECLNTTQINISPSEKYANMALRCNLIVPLIPASVISVHKESRLQWTSFEHVILNISAASALRQAKLMNVTVLFFLGFFFLQYVFSRNRHEIVNCPGLQRDSVSHLYLFPLSKYCQLSKISWGLEGEELIMGKQHPLKFCRVIAQVNLQPFHFLWLLTVPFNALLQMSCLHLLNCTKSILFQIIDYLETFFFFFLF